MSLIQKLPLGSAVEILDSRRVPINSGERARRPGNVPYYGATGQVGFIDSHLFDEELVLLGEDGAPFLDPVKPKAYLVRGKSWVNNHAHVLRGKESLLSNRFLLHQLNSVDYRPFVSGTTRLKLPQGPMRQIPLWVPRFEIQDGIVAEIEKQFTRLDAGIAALRNVQAKLKRYRTAVLNAACQGRLVPTEAELARTENRAYESADDLVNKILVQRRKSWSGRSKYKDPLPSKSDGTLPEGWSWATLDQLLLSVTDGDHQPPPQTVSGIPFLVIGNLKSGTIDLTETRFVSKEYARKVDPFRKPQQGDILYTLVGSFGLAVRVKTNDEFCIQRHIGVLRPHRDSPTDYLSHVLNSAFVFAQASRTATGTAQKTVPLAQLRRFKIPLPPLAEQKRIAVEAERRLSVVEELEAVVSANLQRAARLRQSILQKAFQGELLSNRL